MHYRLSRFMMPAAVLLLLVASPAAAAPVAGTLIRASQPSVYYYAVDGKRYAFPNEKTYLSWYADFSGVVMVSDAELASIPLGGNVTYRPGVRMVKITTDPKVYAVAGGRTLRPIKDEATAASLYGTAWNTKIDDVPDAFFVNYSTGAEIDAAADFYPSAESAFASFIAYDRGLSGASSINGHALPVGDGKYRTSASNGYVYSCQSSFNGGGAFATGSWVSGSTWDPVKKPSVDGSVSWPTAAFTIGKSGANRTFTSNAMPISHTTGTYPISSSDDAYQYDRNPNTIKTQSLSFTLPIDPVAASAPTCVGGEVGIAASGVPIFNGFDAGGRDAVVHEIQDECGGHPQSAGLYHYHGPSACVATGDTELFGYAFDGFGIFSNLEKGRSISNADLDECHGHAHEIVWDGIKKTMYHYHLTKEFPYTVGCFRGQKYVNGPLGGSPGGMGPPPSGP